MTPRPYRFKSLYPLNKKLKRIGRIIFIKPFQRFMHREVTSGQLLLFTTAFAMVWANPDWISDYHAFWHSSVFPLPYPLDTLHFWVNDGLMALFFLVVGLEIKREVMQGELASWQRASLPLFAALGGVLVPALCYILLAGNTAPSGWAIPTATDIAFALGALAVVGSRAPVALKVFLTALAIVDDLLAIAIIALFYTETLHTVWLLPTLGILALLWGLNQWRVLALWPYLLLGAGLWGCLHQLGIHTTLAGVMLAMFIPLQSAKTHVNSPLEALEHKLHPITSYGIVPLFALANAGIDLQPAVVATQYSQPVTLGVFAGLVLGKPLGITAASWLACRLKLAQLPHGVNWGQLAGVSMLGGIGFTMALFVTNLGLSEPTYVEHARLGIVAGSLLSAVLGIGWLALIKPRQD
jgi:Na+:H+ antiporter, NhaA family